MDAPAQPRRSVVATPWDALLVTAPIDSAPLNTASGCLVVNGRRCTSRADIWAAHGLTIPRGGCPAQPVPGSALAARCAASEAPEEELQDALDDVQRIVKQFDRLYYAMRYQARKADPEDKARRAQWEADHREERRSYRMAYDQANKERNKAKKAEWARKKCAADPSAVRQANVDAQRRYYERNKVELAAKRRERSRRKREEMQAMKAAAKAKDQAARLSCA